MRCPLRNANGNIAIICGMPKFHIAIALLYISPHSAQSMLVKKVIVAALGTVPRLTDNLHSQLWAIVGSCRDVLDLSQC